MRVGQQKTVAAHTVSLIQNHFLLCFVGSEIFILYLLSWGQYALIGGEQSILHKCFMLFTSMIKTIVSLGVIGLIYKCFKNSSEDGSDYTEALESKSIFLLNITAFSILSVFLIVPKLSHGVPAGSGYPAGILVSPFLWIILCYSLIKLLFEEQFLKETIQEYWLLILIASISLFLNFFSDLDKMLAAYVGEALIQPTIYLSGELFKISGETISLLRYSNNGYPVVGDERFAAEIHPSCSGYEGLFLIAIFLTAFFYYRRSDFSRLQMIVLSSLCLLSIFALNIVRIALIIYLGSHVSSDIAVNGFHTNFGVFSFLLVVLTCVTFSIYISREQYVIASLNPEYQSFSIKDTTNGLLLLPVIFSIASSIILGLFAGSFNWLYPGTVVITLAGFIPIRRELADILRSSGLQGFVSGFMVFLLWIYLVPDNTDHDREFIEALSTRSGAIQVAWLIFRFIGSSFIVPIAEELAFRNVFWDLIEGFVLQFYKNPAGSVCAFLITSFGFGLMHNDFLAAIIAGAIYGLCRFRFGKVSNAVYAHMTTNMCLAIYVLVTGRWSYW